MKKERLNTCILNKPKRENTDLEFIGTIEKLDDQLRAHIANRGKIAIFINKRQGKNGDFFTVDLAIGKDRQDSPAPAKRYQPQQEMLEDDIPF